MVTIPLTLVYGACFVTFWSLGSSSNRAERNIITPNSNPKILSILEKPTTQKLAAKSEEQPVAWITKWKDIKKLNIPAQQDHFFLERRYLDDFSKELISHAKEDVLIVNPFIQHCDLSDTLIDANRNGVKVQIITRHPNDKNSEYLQRKQRYLSTLSQEGIEVFFDDEAHAKMIVVDEEIAIVSSMNFFGSSSAGISWETGLVTMNPLVVESIVNSFYKALNVFIPNENGVASRDSLVSSAQKIRKSYNVEEIRQKFPRAYEPWTIVEDKQLAEEFRKSLKVYQIATIHKRKRGAIRARLAKIGCYS